MTELGERARRAVLVAVLGIGCGRDAALGGSRGADVLPAMTDGGASGDAPAAAGIGAAGDTPEAVTDAGAAGAAGGAVPTAADAGAAVTGAAGAPPLTPPIVLVHPARASDIHLAVAAGYLYWTETAQGTVNRIALPDGPIEVLAADQPSPGPLAVDATHVFWANGQGPASHEDVLVKRAIAGGAPSIILGRTPDLRDNRAALLVSSFGYNPITGFVVAGDDVYLAESMEDAVEKAPLHLDLDRRTPPPEPTIVARNQPGAGQFAADADRVYWRTCAPTPQSGIVKSCRIMALPR